MTDDITGSYGRAQRIPRDRYAARWPATLDSWVITAPIWHPLWSQYGLSLITLGDVPGVAAAHKTSPEMTHELMVMTIDPDSGPYDPDTNLTLRYLMPGNVAEQFVATDDQALTLIELCAQAVTNGVLCPETADAPDRIRASWRASIHQTLDHSRDPHHGRAN